jgi:hypothetical protein
MMTDVGRGLNKGNLTNETKSSLLRLSSPV